MSVGISPFRFICDVVSLATKPSVELIKHVDLQRLEARDQDPLAKVKFYVLTIVLQKQWSFDVFLNNF